MCDHRSAGRTFPRAMNGLNLFMFQKGEFAETPPERINHVSKIEIQFANLITYPTRSSATSTSIRGPPSTIWKPLISYTSWETNPSRPERLQGEGSVIGIHQSVMTVTAQGVGGGDLDIMPLEMASFQRALHWSSRRSRGWNITG